ncbi:MAG: mechanosensitive ion channel domain-containing protein [Solirubrobacterales bacterium]
MDITSERWFGWSIALIIGLPVLILVLSEVHLVLQRRGNALAGPVNRLRIWLLPLAALLILLTQASDLGEKNAGVRVVATLVGILAVTVALGGLNAVLFGNATEGTWRDRLPSIFVDLARLILIVTGAAVVAAYVWGTNVGGLFATLGVGSIVIGLALQNAIGSVVSGLLLLFEQPFRIGDTLEVGGVEGKVVEMNWRSTHIDIGSGTQIVPNATLAAASFSNLSSPTEAHDLVVETAFAASDPPHAVVATLRRVADSLPILRPGADPFVRVLGAGTYSVSIPLVTAGDAALARTTFLTWLWYASRRDEVSLDGADFQQHPREDVVAALGQFSTTLDLDADEIEAIAGECEIETFGQGEVIVRDGVVPVRFSFIMSGLVRVTARTRDGAAIPVSEQDRGEIVGTSALVREPSPTASTAATIVEVLQVPMTVIDRLAAAKPGVARTLSDLIETRRSQVRTAFEDINASHAVVAPVRSASIRS